MPQVGDLTIYQDHGICRVDEISDKTYGGKTREYIVLRPIDNPQDLTLNLPADNKDKMLSKLMDRAEAEAVLQSFKEEGVEWIEQNSRRTQNYTKRINSGDRVEIAKVASTLLRKKQSQEADGKKLYKNDQELLESIQNTLYTEIALALDITKRAVQTKVNNIIAKSK